MVGQEEGWAGWAPVPGGAPFYIQRSDDWAHFDNTVNAISFGFVATAILIFMFLVMAIFEKFLTPNSPPISPPGGRSRGSASVGLVHNAKLGCPSPEVCVNAKEVSVVMPGDDVPTFIAHPAPIPCPPDHIPFNMNSV